MKKYCGFTLSEVLLVLAIIGIVAALAIPPVLKSITNDRMKVMANKVLASLSNAVNLRHTLAGITPDMYATARGDCPKGALAEYFLIDSKTVGAPPFVIGNTMAWHKPALKTLGDCSTDGNNTVCELADGGTVGFPTINITTCMASAGGCLILVDTNGAGGPTITKKGKTPKDVSASTSGNEPDLIQLIIKDSRVAPANQRTRNILATGDPLKSGAVSP